MQQYTKGEKTQLLGSVEHSSFQELLDSTKTPTSLKE